MSEAIGQRRKLEEGHSKVTGAARYTPDLYLPGMLHARFVPSFYAHADILSIDTSEALAVPGVVAVLTSDDLPDIVPKSRPLLMLARKRVIFAGQPIALVLAENEAAATDGVDKVVVDYDPLPAAVTIEDALAPDAPLVWPSGVPKDAGDAAAHGVEVVEEEEETTPSNIANEGVLERGDVTAGFAEAAVIVEHDFFTPMVHQTPLETQSVIVQPDLVTGGAQVWVSTQGAFYVQKNIANALGVDVSNVRVVGMATGGAFGSKINLYESMTAIVARQMKRPVRLILTRSEEMIAAHPAPPVKASLKLGAKRDGTLVALEGQVWGDLGCYPGLGASGLTAVMMAGNYKLPNFKLQTTDVLTFKQSIDAYRAPCAPSAFFFIDTLIDEIANKLGLDPIDVRVQNMVREGDKMHNDNIWPRIGNVEALEAIRDHPAWQNRAAARKAGRGIGVAVGGWGGGTEPAAAACMLNADGLIHVHVGSSDISGTVTGMTALAAEAFGVNPDQIKVVTGDTSTAPYSGVSGGSKTMYTTGTAVVRAAEAAREQVLTIAAEEFEAAVEDMEIVDGQIQVKGVPNKKISLKEIANKTMDFGQKYAPVYAHGRTAVTDRSPGYSAQLAEVEVDQETGEVQLLRLIVAQDVGRAINPMLIEGQMHGGATQGIGWALHEELVYDDEGQLLSGSFLDYSIPDTLQVAPVIETVMVEVPSEHGPFGAKGVGEPPVVPTAAAIANAIADATDGVRVTQLPMTAPRVLKAINS